MRVTRLCLVIILALTATILSAAPKKKGGSQIHLKAAGACPYYYYCYATPGEVVDCCDDACSCRSQCDDACGTCDWDNTCIT